MRSLNHIEAANIAFASQKALKKSAQKGFTLIEVLLAIMIFAALSMAAYQVLNQVQRSNAISLERTQRLEDIQRALIILDNDFRQITPRPFSYQGSDNQMFFSGEGLLNSEDNGIIYVRLGWTNPNYMFPRSEELKVGYRLTDKGLERVWWYYPDTEEGQSELRRRLLDGVSGLSFRFYNGDEWTDRWTETEKLPEGLEVIITLEDYGDISRVYTLPGQVNNDTEEVTQ